MCFILRFVYVIIKSKSMNKILCVLFVFVVAIITRSYAQSDQNSLKDKLLIVLDVQDYSTQKLSEDASEQFINTVNGIIEKVNPENVIYVKAIHRRLNLTLTKIYVDTLPNLDLDKRLKIVNENIFNKTKGNAFNSEALVNFVKDKEKKDIVVIGLMAEHCAKETLLGGDKLGYNMYFIPEALLGESDKSKLKTFNKLKKKGIKELSLN